LEQFYAVDSRITTVDVQPQECITRDNVPLQVNAVIYYRVNKPDKAIVEVVDYHVATIEIAQSSLRSVIGQRTLDQILSDIKETASALQELVDVATDEWGVKVTRVEIKDIKIPDDMKRAMAIEAEAERERRAMVIRASGEKEAARQLSEAAKVLDETSSGFHMRYLQTLLQVAESGNTVVFADPKLGGTALAAAAARAKQQKTEPEREIENSSEET
jgi:regulator of protease activity HflC (stomatin/prohibitin superfamily)